jgi:hypothetical protein
MNLDARWVLLTVVVAGGAAAAWKSRRRRRRTVRDLEYRTEIKSWENEGGNLAPIPVAPTPT